jgi:hypothetical protein
MVRRMPPNNAPVVSGSTPVVAFGDPGKAEVATLGINPSAAEFLEEGRLLTDGRRRLATLQSLGARRLDQLTDAQIRTVVGECYTYFQRQPYRKWFDPLDRILQEAVDVSYYDGSACHLDLVQWATEPIWGKIPDAGIRRSLLDDGVPHLQRQLSQEHVRLVIMNGRQVIDRIVALGLADLDEVGRLPIGRTACLLFAGTGGGVQWVGWSANLQSSWGVSGEFREQLGTWLTGVCIAPREGPFVTAARPSGPEPDVEGHLPAGLLIKGKAELVTVLRRWLSRSGASTLGEVGRFGGRPWLLVDVGNQGVVINADTKRSAVETFVRESQRRPGRPWRVVANRNGRINKVIPRPLPDPLPGWYAYIGRPLEAEGTI